MFSRSGGEVKVTRASRDGGVDAIAFDPNPIRGGKIVIQAKRYTNTVEVSAVRDLYGTVVNEGAIKGILVTTSTFGPDAYAFAKDKPLTLLDGGNLLHLLEQHGHRAHIDLAEAKRLNTTPLARSTASSTLNPSRSPLNGAAGEPCCHPIPRAVADGLAIPYF
jgi:restriction system protein